jgi:hypothetical protein
VGCFVGVVGVYDKDMLQPVNRVYMELNEYSSDLERTFDKTLSGGLVRRVSGEVRLASVD